MWLNKIFPLLAGACILSCTVCREIKSDPH